MRTGLFAAAAAGLILATASVPTSAAIIDGTFTFSASGFQPPGYSFTDPVKGSFSVYFDNSATITSLTISNLSTNLAGYGVGVGLDYYKPSDEIDLELSNGLSIYTNFGAT